MKTKEELNALKEEVKALNMKLAELTEEELKQVVGGVNVPFDTPKGSGTDTNSTFKKPDEGPNQYDIHIYT